MIQAPKGWRRALLQVTDVVDADRLFRSVEDRLLSGDVGFAENVSLAIERLVLPDGLDGLARGVQDGADGAGAIILFNVGRDAHILVALLDEDRGVPRVFFATSSTSSKLLFILVEPK